MNTRLLALGILLVAVGGGITVFFLDEPDQHAERSKQSKNGMAQDASGRRVLYWYDPMMPQHRFDKPGKSPFMDMQLVPKYADESGSASVRIDQTVQQNLGIRLANVERASFGSRVVAVGRLEANERALHAVPSRVSGYVENLEVRAVGDPVKRGQRLAQIYSAELLSAQQEFLALRKAQDLSDRSELTTAARQRLRLLGMAESEIDALERSGEAAARFGVYSPANGFVTELATREGGLVQSGATLVSIADLTSLWLIADVPEREATAIQPGDEVRATFAGGSQETINGVVDAIYPVLNTETRTARVRIIVSNKQGTLRPGMLANVAISAAQRESLAVPSEAVIYTGTRSIVIIKQDGTFRPAEVRVGGELGDRTEILSGVTEGEQVVASGQFLIDSEASLNGVLARLSGPQASGAAEKVERDSEPPLISSQGTVINVDHANGRVTIAHEPIAELQWPAMTMPFRLADPQALHSLTVGERLRFTLRAKPQDGEYIIESVTKETAR